MRKISIIILISRKLGLVGLVQQKIKLPSPNILQKISIHIFKDINTSSQRLRLRVKDHF